MKPPQDEQLEQMDDILIRNLIIDMNLSLDKTYIETTQIFSEACLLMQQPLTPTMH